MLEKRVPMKDIAAQTGFHKSSIGRHSLKCLARDAAKKLKARQFDHTRQRFISIDTEGVVRWIVDPYKPNAILAELIADWQQNPRADDVVLRATFDDLPTRRTVTPDVRVGGAIAIENPSPNPETPELVN